jgi:hypothetical protein
MFSLGQRLSEKPGIDFSGYTEHAGMYSKLIPAKGKQKNELTNFLQKQPVKTPFKINEYYTDPHLTVIWSKQAVSKRDVLGVCENICKLYRGVITSATYWEGHNKIGYVVLNVESDDIHSLHELLVKMGAVHSHNTFEAHITIATHVGAQNPEIRNWIAAVNDRLKQRPMPITFTSLSFCDLYD